MTSCHRHWLRQHEVALARSGRRQPHKQNQSEIEVRVERYAAGPLHHRDHPGHLHHVTLTVGREATLLIASLVDEPAAHPVTQSENADVSAL